MKKIISIVLAVTLVFTALLAVTQTVSATGASWAIQVARSSGGAFDYSAFDWSGFGTNLVPDPTVSHFDVGGEYGRYAKFNSGHNPVAQNSYYWWDKYNDPEYGFKKYIDDLINGGNLNVSSLTQDGNGYYELVPGHNYGKPSGTTTFNAAMRSPLNWNAVKKGTGGTEYASLTDDGSGVLRYSSSGAWRAVPLPELEADKYYVIKFNMKAVDSKNGSLELCLQFDNGNTDLGTNAAAVTLGSGLGNNKVDTVAFVVYTGSNTYSDPFIKFYCQTETFFDDFGVYEVTEEYATAQSASTKLTDPPEQTPAVESSVFQVSRSGSTGNGSAFDYSDFDWSLFGENLVPDPTVNHFEEGVYGTYATPDSEWKPENIDDYYWWDKYLEEYNGFTMFKQDMADNGQLDYKTFGGGYINGYQSPKARSMTQTSGSLTDDGTGVLRTSSGGGTRGVSLPALEANKYYVIKFNVKCASQMDNAVDFCFEPNLTNTLGAEAASINMGSGFANGKVNTACFVAYTGTNDYENPLVKIYCTNSIYVYLDDFGVYEVSEEYALEQSVGVKLTDPRSYVLSPDYSVTSSASNNGTLIYDYSSAIPSNTKLGANLVTDPTVSDFEGGEYSADGWWNTKVENYNGDPNQSGSMAANDNLIYTSPKYRGLISEDTANSHTDDGSGAIVLQTGPKTGNTSNRNFYLPLPAMESYSYYLVSMWVNTDAFALAEFALGLNTSTTPLFAQLKQFDSGWKQIVTVVYTGANSYAKPFIKVMDVKDTELNAYIDKTIIIDDIGVYEINDVAYGAACVENNYVIKDTVDITDTGFLKQDVDGNGAVNQFDIAYLRENELGTKTLTRSVNEDDTVDVKDYVSSKKYLLLLG